MAILKWLRRFFANFKTKEDISVVYEVVENRRLDSQIVRIKQQLSEGDYEELDSLGEPETPIRRIDACQLNENQGRIRVIITLKQQSQLLIEEKTICEALTLTDIDDLIIGGRLSNRACSLLTNIVRCRKIKIDNSVISCRLDWLSQIFRRSREVELINCTFEDAQVICDELFISNPQLCRVKILNNTRKYSFPLVTDNTLRLWAQQRQVYNVQLRADTSFTVAGVKYLTKSLLNTESSRWSSLYLGKIASSPEACKELHMPEGLLLECNGRRFFIKNTEGRLLVSFDTSAARSAIEYFSTEV